jgi:glycine dehydrogenase subunit 1
MSERDVVNPYAPNSVGRIKAQMMKEIGIDDIMELYEEIPDRLRFKGSMDLPEPIRDEYSIKRHLEQLLDRNHNCSDHLNFLGAGCAQHFVPAVCDEINGRGEFLTAYSGFFWADHGKWQAWFEYSSMMGELLDMDFLGLPQYDGSQAAATSLRMASGLTGRKQVLLPKSMNPEVLTVSRNYSSAVSESLIDIELVAFDPKTGLLDLADLKSKISSETAAVYIENPTYLGVIETQAEEIGTIARENGAEFIVYADPISLGVLAPPAQYGATIACGDFHPLGLHMQCGGGQAGFIATHGSMEYASRFKDIIPTVVPTVKEGEYGCRRWARRSCKRRSTRPDGSASSRGSNSSSAPPSSRNSWCASTRPARASARSTKPCSSTRSSGVWTYPLTSASLARAPSTASPRS